MLTVRSFSEPCASRTSFAVWFAISKLCWLTSRTLVHCASTSSVDAALFCAASAIACDDEWICVLFAFSSCVEVVIAPITPRNWETMPWKLCAMSPSSSLRLSYPIDSVIRLPCARSPSRFAMRWIGRNKLRSKYSTTTNRTTHSTPPSSNIMAICRYARCMAMPLLKSILRRTGFSHVLMKNGVM